MRPIAEYDTTLDAVSLERSTKTRQFKDEMNKAFRMTSSVSESYIYKFYPVAWKEHFWLIADCNFTDSVGLKTKKYELAIDFVMDLTSIKKILTTSIRDSMRNSYPLLASRSQRKGSSGQEPSEARVRHSWASDRFFPQDKRGRIHGWYVAFLLCEGGDSTSSLPFWLVHD